MLYVLTIARTVLYLARTAVRKSRERLMPRYDAKSDANQSDIVESLRTIGATVESLHRVGAGCPDLLVGFRGVNVLMEVKTDKGKLRETQVAWHDEWRGQVAIVRNADDAFLVLEQVTT